MVKREKQSYISTFVGLVLEFIGKVHANVAIQTAMSVDSSVPQHRLRHWCWKVSSCS